MTTVNQHIRDLCIFSINCNTRDRLTARDETMFVSCGRYLTTYSPCSGGEEKGWMITIKQQICDSAANSLAEPLATSAGLSE